MTQFWLNVVGFSSFIFNVYAFELRILHTNDVHAHFVEFNEFGGRCPPNYAQEGKCFGGFARQYAKVNEFKKCKPNVIFLNGGDFFQGTIWYTLYKYKVVAEFVNELLIDAMCLGNHEFDDGAEGLIPYLKVLKMPVVGCNINATKDPELQELIKPSIVLKVGVEEEKIGIIGYLTPKTKYLSNPGNVEFTDEIECVKQEAERLAKDGIDKIIAVGHSGYVMDLEIAKQIPEIDIVVGGHTNTFLYTGTPPSAEIPQGPYPTIVNRADGSKALVVQDFEFGKYLGYLKVSFTEDGRVDHWEGNPILLNNSVKQDKRILNQLQHYVQEIEEIGKQEVGKTNVLLRNSDCHQYKECNLGNFLTDAFLDHFASERTEKGWTNVAVSLWNSGGIRSSVDERINNGSIILEDLMTITPFRNKMYTVRLKGKDLREVLEESIRNYDPLGPHGAFLQVSGLRIIYNVTNPVGSRLRNVQIRCAECRVPKFEPLENERLYEIVMPEYLTKGGDGYTIIPEKAQYVQKSDAVDIDIIKEYMKKMKPIIHGIENRITFL